MRREFTSDMETKELCGAAWPSKGLKRKEGNPSCPLNAPKKFSISRATHSKRSAVPHGHIARRAGQMSNFLKRDFWGVTGHLSD
jgi:hypothetical protein